ncbi:MAG: hypothetical protein JWP26_2933 [Devosia sp.]|uniref:hypothetical protein n=1 Tax=Devosia sp. TaxID=1871048 RepID=UPI002610D61E|nr:hypothetical protein [Devosia sp.]MDB5538108.1 hypothetical protein [Devosia sp.]MDB5587963.1 hypothetical protein [Devosia sp.]
MNNKAKWVCLAWMLSLAPALAEPLDEHILAQLACQKSPEPAYTLIALDRGERIAGDAALLMDSATCWPIAPELDVAGMSFSAVCASAEDPLLLEEFPDYFWRGPGTSPGTALTLVTKADLATAKTWAQANLGETETHYTVAESYRVEGGVEIDCSSLSFVE